MIKRVISSLAISLTIFVFLLVLMLVPLRERGQLLDGEWTVVYEDGSGEITPLPFYLRLDRPSSAVFTYRPLADNHRTLALVWPDVTSFSVFWNDTLIHRAGDPECPTADFWNYFHLIELPEPPDGKDVLKIEATGYYGINIGRVPFIGDRTILQGQAFFHNLIYDRLTSVFMGATLLLSLFLMILPTKERRIKISSRFLGIAAVLACIHVMDYLHWETLGNLVSYVIIKKAFYLCGPAASLFFTLSLENYYKGRIYFSRFLIPPVLLSSLVILVLELDKVRYLLPYVNFIFFANLLFIILIILRHPGSKWALLITAQVIALSVFEVLLVLFLELPWPLVTQNVLLFATFLYGIQLIGLYNDIYHKHQQLEGENLRDPLTGALNRRYLEKIDPTEFELVAVIDLDNFKYYNDTYGHHEGDELLKTFVKILKRNLRKDDPVIRYGGDEFILFIKYASFDDGKCIFKRIENEFFSSVKDSKVGFSYGIKSSLGTAEDSIKQADGAMYAMKNMKKAEQL